MNLLIPIIAAACIAVFFALRSKRRFQFRPGATEAFYHCDPPATLAGTSPDLAYIDEFLARWDRFAQGANELLPDLQKDTPRFNAELVRALAQDPQAGLPRAVLYPILQVGGFVPAGSGLGRALAKATGLTPKSIAGEPYFFAGDLYAWWESQRSQYPAYPPYERWREGEFAREVAIPLFTTARPK